VSRSGRGRREPRSDRPTLGERIRRERQRLGLTQAELAGEEMTKSFISQVEADLARPSLRTLQLLAQRLNRPVSYFLDEPEVDPPAPPLAAFPALRQARALAAAGATAQALERLDQALVELPPTDLLSQARLLSLRAELMASTGPPDQVVHAYRQAADAWRATGDEREEASLLLHWARYEMTRGRTDRAIRLLERGLDRLGDSPEDEWLQANLRAELGLALARRGAPAEAIEHLKEALWAMDDLTDFARYGEVALTLGRLLGQTGEHEAAQVMVERSLYFFQALGDRERTIDGYLHLTWVKARAGQGDGARWAVEQADRMARELPPGHRLQTAVLRARAWLAALEGQVSAAQALWGAAIQAAGPQDRPWVHRELARLLWREGRLEEAQTQLQKTLDLLEGSGDADAPLGPVREELARVCEQLGQLDRAAGLFAGALDWFQKKGMTGGWMDSGALWLLDLTRG